MSKLMLVALLLPLKVSAQELDTAALLQRAETAINFEQLHSGTESILASLEGSNNFGKNFREGSFAQERAEKLKANDLAGTEELKSIAKRGAELPSHKADIEEVTAKAYDYDLEHTHRQLQTKIGALAMLKSEEENDELVKALEQLTLLDTMLGEFNGQVPEKEEDLKIFAGVAKSVKNGKPEEEMQHLLARGLCASVAEGKTKGGFGRNSNHYHNYCCFDSQFIKIIRQGLHEQEIVSLGEYDNPRCHEAIAIQSLAELDWQRIDFSEIFEEPEALLKQDIDAEGLDTNQPSELNYVVVDIAEADDEECDPENSKECRNHIKTSNKLGIKRRGL